ncbi:hypothetical protein AAHC47_002902 [Listeria monocytogenes]
MKMEGSIISYPSRGHYGNSDYRGNCSGKLIRDLIQQFHGERIPVKFVEVFAGGGTGKDVATELGIYNSIHLDLASGWNALKDDIPSGADFVFSHPPYWDIIKYEFVRNQYHADDLSNVMSYEEFICKLDKVNEKIYHSLVNGGRHAFLVGDVRKKGKYFSIIKDMTWFGDLEAHIIKEQHNTFSGRKSYNGSFIPIQHEHLLVFKKNDIWDVAIKFTKDFTRNMKELKNPTWRDLVQAAIEGSGGIANTDAIYDCLKTSEKAKSNQHLRAKIRQILNVHSNFKKEETGWILDL